MTESFRAQKLSVSLSCNDLQKSLAWYRDVVGFTEGERYERDGSLRAVVLGAGDMQILIGQDDGAKGMNRAKGQGMSFQFTTDQSVDDIANRIKVNGGTLESDPIDTPWGARTFRLADPDGFTLVISSERSR
jgi:uncharacterized glyoxalase superfamily protein PhnB